MAHLSKERGVHSSTLKTKDELQGPSFLCSSLTNLHLVINM